MQLRTLIAFSIVVMAIVGACGDDDGASSPASTASPSSTQSPTVMEADTSTSDPTAGTSTPECDAYLNYISAQDGAQLNTALGELRSQIDDEDVDAALDTIEQSSGDLGELADARNVLRAAVEPMCTEQWSAGVVPYSDDDLAQVFYEAVLSGDRSVAAEVAPADVLAEFEPWEPIPADDSLGSPTLTENPDGSFNMLLGSTITVYCETQEGVVTLCGFGE